MKLADIITGRTNSPRRVMLYGIAGVGKTTLAASTRSPVFVQLEDGIDDVGAPRFPLCKDLDSVLACLRSLYAEDHDFRTVVIDSIDWLERAIFQRVAEDRSVRSIEEIGYGKGYQFALEHWRRVLAALDALRTDRGLAVVLVAHSAIVRFEDPTTEAYDRHSPRLHKTANALVTEWCDEVLFATYRVRTRQTGDGMSRRAKGIGTGERLLLTTERPSHIAKNRCGLDDEIAFDPETFARIVAGEFTTREDSKNG